MCVELWNWALGQPLSPTMNNPEKSTHDHPQVVAGGNVAARDSLAVVHHLAYIIHLHSIITIRLLRVHPLLESGQDLRRLVRLVVKRHVRGALPLLLRERPLLHRGHGVARPLEVVLEVARCEYRRFLYRREDDVIVRAVRDISDP
jgi:hypothetical protein